MRAIRISAYGGPEVLDLVEIPPPSPQPSEVLVRLQAIGVGMPDVLVRTGVYKWKPPVPTVVGAEGAGYVVEVGELVTGLAVGDPVLVRWGALGCYAEFVTAAAEKIVKLPAGFDPDLAVHVPNYITAHALLTDAARGTRASTLYVNGAAGGLGVALIQLARRRGLEVIAGAGSQRKCDFVRAQGASHTINYGDIDPVEEVLRLTGGRGAGLIFDQFIGPDFTRTLEMVAPLGMIISFNMLKGLPEENLFAAMRRHLGKAPAVCCYSGHVYDSDRERLAEIEAEVLELVGCGAVAPHVHATLPMAEARRAHEMLAAREVLGKIVLKP